MNGTSESTGRLSAPVSENPSKTGRRVLLGVFLVGLAILSGQIFISPLIPIPDGILATLVLLLAFATTLTSAAGRIPWQNVLLATAVIGAIGGGVHLLGSLTGIPFGPVVYNQEAGPQILNSMSWSIPLIWVIAILNSRGVARLILRPWRKLRVYGYWLIGVTAFLTLLFDCGLEPFATCFKHYWFWHPTKLPIDWYGTPLSNFLGWIVTALLILAFSTPSLMKKKPTKSARDYSPLIVWVSLNLLFLAGCAAQHLWVATALSASACGAVILFAILGAKW